MNSTSPIKVYLDHSNYIQFAGQLEKHGKYYDDYIVLKQLVADGKIRVFFSWAHVYEALKFQSSRDELFISYSKVVDGLTEGNCFLSKRSFIKNEIWNYVATLSGKSSATTKSMEGIGLDALIDRGIFRDRILHLKEDGIRIAMQEISKLNLRTAYKLNYINLLRDRPGFYEAIICSQDLTVLAEQFNDMFPTERRFWDADAVKRLLSKDRALSAAVLEDFFQEIALFSNLLLYYRKRRELQDGVLNIRDMLINIVDSGDELATQLKLGHISIAELENGVHNISENVRHRTIDGFIDYVSECAYGCFVDVEYAKNSFCDDNLCSIKSIDAMINFWSAYITVICKNYKSFKHSSESVAMDLVHASHAPYVDYFVADRSFSSVIRNAAMHYGTEILRNTHELIDAIN